MLDTNIISDFIRNPRGAAAGRARAHEGALCTSIIVAAELRYGCVKKGSAGLLRRVELLLQEIEVLAFDAPADWEYGRIRCALEAQGQVIGANDLFIAAHACSLGLVLVTGNVREFSRVRGLQVEDWLSGRLQNL
jgi:tRNA(fMet)-specific endonuclease VapC